MRFCYEGGNTVAGEERMAKPKKGFHDLFAQIPEPLWAALSTEADKEQRSITAQLVHLLRERYPDVQIDCGPKPRLGRPPKMK